MQLSQHLSLAEFCHSNTAVEKGIDNTIKDPVHLENAKRLAENVFQPIRAYLNKPIRVNSGYRSKDLNKAIPGSSNTSQHCFGEAMDLNLSDRKIFEWIIDNVEFDQLIFEGGNENWAAWFHISYREGRNRKEVLRMVKKGKASTYQKYVRMK